MKTAGIMNSYVPLRSRQQGIDLVRRLQFRSSDHKLIVTPVYQKLIYTDPRNEFPEQKGYIDVLMRQTKKREEPWQLKLSLPGENLLMKHSKLKPQVIKGRKK